MKKIKKSLAIIILASMFLLNACENNGVNSAANEPHNQTIEKTSIPAVKVTPSITPKQTETPAPTAKPTDSPTASEKDNVYEYDGKSYTIIEVDGGDLSGERQPNVAVDVGYGDRVYWGLTNEYGQLIHVIADEVILQDDKNEPVTSDGRYYEDEAKVLGTEQKDLDEGHVIADSLGGVSNAYNITPQNSTLNRHGDQAYMEKVLRDAGGCTNFVATITYSDTDTQIPEKYKYEYIINGNSVVDEFDNVDPDEINSKLSDNDDNNSETGTNNVINDTDSQNEDLSSVDTNGNGKVTIAEAKAAGYAMPIHSDHWLYKYMDDRDGDGMVGE